MLQNNLGQGVEREVSGEVDKAARREQFSFYISIASGVIPQITQHPADLARQTVAFS